MSFYLLKIFATYESTYGPILRKNAQSGRAAAAAGIHAGRPSAANAAGNAAADAAAYAGPAATA